MIAPESPGTLVAVANLALLGAVAVGLAGFPSMLVAHALAGDRENQSFPKK